MKGISLTRKWRVALLIAVAALTALSTSVAAFAAGQGGGQGPPSQPGQEELERVHQRLLPLFVLPGVVYTDAREDLGRLEVGVIGREVFGPVERELERLNVSRSLVDIVVTEPIVSLVTLRDRVRPVQGGLQTAFSVYVCTVGFNATRAGVAGFVTNSHCTKKQGGVESTVHYQPTSGANNRTGVETADPQYFKGGACPINKKCRYSDSAFIAYDAGVTSALGSIEQTALGSLTITGSYQIVSEGSSSVEDVVNKVGRTTGRSQGTVTNTCVNTGVLGTNILQLCQDFVTAAVGGGDSGSPVFAIVSGNTVQLRGVLWGGNQSGTMFVYSPIANVEGATELGPLTTQ